MWQTIKDSYTAFNATFVKSGVIFFARLQVLLGIIFTVAAATDLSPILGNGKWLTVWLIASGVITEITRKRGTVVVDGALVPKTAITVAPVVVAPVVLAPTDSTTK